MIKSLMILPTKIQQNKAFVKGFAKFFLQLNINLL